MKGRKRALPSSSADTPSTSALPPTPPATPTGSNKSLPKGNLREVIPATQAVVSPPVVQPTAGTNIQKKLSYNL